MRAMPKQVHLSRCARPQKCLVKLHAGLDRDQRVIGCAVNKGRRCIWCDLERGCVLLLPILAVAGWEGAQHGTVGNQVAVFFPLSPAMLLALHNGSVAMPRPASTGTISRIDGGGGAWANALMVNAIEDSANKTLRFDLTTQGVRTMF